MADYRKLRAFELAQQLSEDVHALAPSIPARRAPGLRAQLCRAAASVPANIAEGAAQESQAHFARFLSIAQGSVQEVAVHLSLARSVGGPAVNELHRCEDHARLVGAMLSKLIARIRENEARAEQERRTTGR